MPCFQIDRMKEHEREEFNLKSAHLEELKCIQLQAEKDLREVVQLRIQALEHQVLIDKFIFYLTNSSFPENNHTQK